MITMAELAAKRQEKFNYKILKAFPGLGTVETKTFLGAYSWTQPYTQTRIMRAMDLLDIGYGKQTPTEITRDYLECKFEEPLRATGAQAEAFLLHRAAPLLAKPQVLRDAVYIDIRSAYWTIVNTVGWNVDYFPSKFLGRGSTCEDFPLKDHKPARSSLVSMGLPSNVRVWDGKTFHVESSRNKNLNVGLWALTMDILHAIAWQARLYGAIYIHTDGFIFPRAMSRPFTDFIRDSGLDCRIKLAGDCEVRGVGQYKIGSYKSGRWTDAPMYHSYIYEVDSNWLLPRFARFAALRPSFKEDFTLQTEG